MNINLRQLRAFASIGHLASFTKAANVLHTSQPALSAQILQLEDALGVRLFDRSTRSVALTQAGADLLPVVDKLLADLQGVVARAHDVAQKNIGRVTLAALPTVSSTLLPVAVARMRERHPGITIVLKDALAERIVSLIRSGDVDFGITSAPPSDSRLVFRPLATDRMVAVLPRGHPLLRARKITLANLLDVPLILMDRESSVRRIVDDACVAEGRLPAPAYEPTFMSTAIGMVRGGLGATLLPSSAIELKGASDVVVRRLDNPRLERKLGLLRQRERSLSPAAEAFVALLQALATSWFREQDGKSARRAPRRAEARSG
jgi:DNA-binding transcriptional LysR family regulator